jgi:WD40 repeat protein
VALSGSRHAQVRETLFGKLKFNAPFWNPYTKLSLPLERLTWSRISTTPMLKLAAWAQSDIQFQPVTLPGPQQVVRAMSFSPDGKRLAVGGWQTIEYSNADGSSRNYKTQGRVRVFETTRGRILKTFEVADARVYGVRWTSRSRLVAECGDGRNRAFVVPALRR